MVLLRKGSFSSNSCPSAVRAFSVLHPVCVLVRVLLVFDVRVLRFCLSLRFTRRRAAFYLRGRHREVNSTILTVAILMQGRLPSIHRDWPEAGQEDKLFGGLLFRRGWNSQFHQISEMIIRWPHQTTWQNTGSSNWNNSWSCCNRILVLLCRMGSSFFDSKELGWTGTIQVLSGTFQSFRGLQKIVMRPCAAIVHEFRNLSRAQPCLASSNLEGGVCVCVSQIQSGNACAGPPPVQSLSLSDLRPERFDVWDFFKIWFV